MAQYWIDFNDLADLSDFQIEGDYTVELVDDGGTQVLKLTQVGNQNRSTAVTYTSADGAGTVDVAAYCKAPDSDTSPRSAGVCARITGTGTSIDGYSALALNAANNGGYLMRYDGGGSTTLGSAQPGDPDPTVYHWRALVCDGSTLDHYAWAGTDGDADQRPATPMLSETDANYTTGRAGFIGSQMRDDPEVAYCRILAIGTNGDPAPTSDPGGGGGVTLTVQSATHGHTAAVPSLTQAHTLAPAAAQHAHTADAPTLSSAVQLAVAEAAHSHTAEAPTLTQAYVLTVAEAAHAHSAESPALTQAHTLSPADTQHGHTAASPDLVQAHALAVAEALHGHTAESPSLTQANTLAPAAAQHAHTSETVTLGTGTVLSVAGALHGHTAASPSLTQAHILAVQTASHAHTADLPTLAQSITLVPAEAQHGHTAATVTLTTADVIAVDAARHAHGAESPTLTVDATLVVSDALHAHLADNVIFAGTVFAAGRLMVVEVPDRLLIVAPADRIIKVTH